MKLLCSTFLLSILLGSCSINQYTANSVVPENAKEAILDLSANVDQRTDPFRIKHMEQVGDFILIDVSYSGGCEMHVFDLISNGQFTATYPTELETILVHYANGDKCRSIVDERIYFDLRPYQYSGTSLVRIILNNKDKSYLDYNY